MPAMLGLYCRLSALLLLLWLGACTAQRATRGPDVLDPERAGRVPALPAERAVLGLTDFLIHGNSTYDQSAGAEVSGSDLILSAAPGGLAWAIYRFTPAGGDVDSVAAVMDPPAGHAAYIAFADYTMQRWSINGPYTDSKTVAADDTGFISPQDNFYVAIIVADGDSVTVDAISIRTFNPQNVAPQADVTADPVSGPAPLTVELDAAESFDSDGVIMHYLWDFDGNGAYEEISVTPQIEHVFTAQGSQQVSLAVQDNLGAFGTATTTVIVNGSSNLPPSAQVGADQSGGTVPLQVGFDASLSSDPDGSIVRYEWDFNGDGAFESYGSVPAVEHTFAASGLYYVLLLVTDNDGATDSSWLTISANEPAQTVDNDGDAGQYTSLALIGNRPAIAYYSVSADALQFVRALDFDGTQWSEPVTVDALGSAGKYASLAEVNGRPAISYVGSAHLNYVRADDGEGASWPLPFEVDVSEQQFTSLAVVGDVPAIAYYDVAGADLQYVLAKDENGADWNVPMDVQSSGDVGISASLKYISTAACIAYFRPTGQNVEFIRATDTVGNAWGEPVIIDDSGSAGPSVALASISNHPAVAYSRPSPSNELMYARAADPAGSAFAEPLIVWGLAGAESQQVALASISGVPAIAFYAPLAKDVLYVSAFDSLGANWSLPRRLDGPGDVGQFVSLISSQLLPVTSYYDNTHGALKVALQSGP